MLAPGGSAFDESDSHYADRQFTEGREDNTDASGGGRRGTADPLVFDLYNDPGGSTVVVLETLGDFFDERSTHLFNGETGHLNLPTTLPGRLHPWLAGVKVHILVVNLNGVPSGALVQLVESTDHLVLRCPRII